MSTLHDIKPLLIGDAKKDLLETDTVMEKIDENFRNVNTGKAEQSDMATVQANIAALQSAVAALQANIITPHYVGSWTDLAAGATTTITHNLGGDVNNYLIDFRFRNGEDNTTGNIINYGGNEAAGTLYGWFWYNLTTTQITVKRNAGEVSSSKFRIVIWKYS